MVAFVRGIVTYFRALSFITSRGLSKYFLYSGLIGFAIILLFGGLIYGSAPFISEWLTSIIPWEMDITSAIYKWLSVAFTSVLFFSIFKYLMLIFTAPLMSVLSERVEYELTGEDYPGGKVLHILKEIARGIRINLRNIVREIGVTILLFILSFIPIFSVITGPLIILVQGYYAGFGNHDFWAERHFSYRDTVRFMKSHKGMVAGNGVVYVFLLAIPILGAFIAPPLSTVAATMEGIITLEQEYEDY